MLTEDGEQCCQDCDSATDAWFWTPTKILEPYFEENEETGLMWRDESKDTWKIEMWPAYRTVCFGCGFVGSTDEYLDNIRSMDMSYDGKTDLLREEIETLLTIWGQDIALWHRGETPPPVHNIDADGRSKEFLDYNHQQYLDYVNKQSGE